MIKVKLMKAERFEDLEIWKRRRVLNKRLYKLFGNLQDFIFRNQKLRASISVTNIIAKGFELRINA